MPNFVNISDLKNPKTGLTFREENLLRVHNIPLGTLVEVSIDNPITGDIDPKNGLRLFVVEHNRDCDGTPLYSLSFNKDWKPDIYNCLFGEEHSRFIARHMVDSGYSEGCLKVVESDDNKAILSSVKRILKKAKDDYTQNYDCGNLAIFEHGIAIGIERCLNAIETEQLNN